MIPLAPALVVAAATAFVGSASWRGRRAQLFLDDEWPTAHDWPTTFVHYIGFWSLYDSAIEASSWPFPITASRELIVRLTEPRELLVKVPHAGDLFLASGPVAAGTSSIGIVASVDGSHPIARGEDWVLECTTIEGVSLASETDPERYAIRRVRRFNTHVGDRFVRWADLDRR